MDTSIVDQIITGRVHPHIYAFRTSTIPDYLKVGDTYRPVEIRLNEWRTHYNALKEVYRERADVGEDVYFRDFAVHQFLEDVLKLHRLQHEDIPPDIYFSNEFFKGATEKDIQSAVDDIRSDYITNGNRYSYYKFEESRIPVETHYPRSDKPFNPREEQTQTVKNFLKAIQHGRRNLLMYAVMRFGKSFTAMLCARKMNAKLVVVLCGKTSVEDEWKRNVEIPKNFEGYSFKNRKDLDNNHNLISEAKVKGERTVLFLTLQDLVGVNVKERHKDLFENEIDLVIIDETHFGVRAPEYGKILHEEFGIKAVTEDKEYQDEEEIKNVAAVLKTLRTNIRLHFSGTPYRILMGSEFAPEDVIAFYQFSDIVDAQQKWDRENLDNPEKKEWDNPYYGFPQMIRFAFNPSASARKLIRELREKGKSCTLSALFQPASITKDNEAKYRIFEHEQEILELLEVIDGSREDEELFGFLDNDKIKNGRMCRHLVFVLPFRASCDALQTLIENNIERFRILSQYVLLNIAGHDCPSELQTPSGVKSKIQSYEMQNRKTITLTVNKMLTGSTVEYWDTMLFFKDTASPQEYDQAIFRIQNPYVKVMKAENGDEIKFNMKPQTLLLDFDIDRLFRLQALKSQIFNTNIEVNGNAELMGRIRHELEISPVIILNKDRLKEVTPNDIMEAVSEYSRNRSVADEAKDIPVDLRLMDDPIIKALIDRQGTMSSKDGLSIKPNKEDGDDYETVGDSGDESELENCEGPAEIKAKDSNESPEVVFCKKFATFYSRILFFAFLSIDKITNLNDVIHSIDNNKDNKRIAGHLDLRKNELVHLKDVMDGNKVGILEFKVQNLNRLEKDEDLTPLERAKTAMRRFSRLSEAEVTTPENVARDMVSLLPDDCTPSMKFLDIASKQGEFAIALVERFGDQAKSSIWSLPTSGIAYEFTRKIYDFLGMPVDNIYDSFNSFGLINNNKQEYIDSLNKMKFDVIIGNPPYQAAKATGKAGINKAFSSAIYPFFVDVARILKPRYISLITPSRWMTGTGQGITDNWVSELTTCNHFITVHDFYNSTDCFKDVELKGGVSYFIYSDFYTGDCHYVLHQAGEVFSNKGTLNALGTGIVLRDPKALEIIDKIKKIDGNYFEEGRTFSKLVGPQHFFDKDGKLTTRWKGYTLKKGGVYRVKYYLNRQIVPQGYAWIKKSDIPKNTEIVSLHKVYLSKAFNGGDAIPHQIIGHAFYGEPGSVCSQTYLVIGWDQKEHLLSELECRNMITYMNTRFFRYLVFIKKKTQDNPSAVFNYVPLQDFSKPWSDSELYEKYDLTGDEIRFIEATIKSME